MTADHPIRLKINGDPVEAVVSPRCVLVDFLRDRVRLTGTHAGCREGICGSCTILVDGRSARACLTLAVQVDGADVTTVEGVGGPDVLSTAQAALVEHRAIQCGFCTPGVVMVIEELLAEVDRGTRPTHADVLDRLSSVLCRCTGYAPIVAAAKACVNERTGGRAT